MASQYAKYVRERGMDEIIEREYGFVTYRYLDDGAVYIVEIFVEPEMRQSGYASRIADEVAELAKSRGSKEMIGTVNPSAWGSTASLKVLLAYGMTLKSASDNLIVMRKDI